MAPRNSMNSGGFTNGGPAKILIIEDNAAERDALKLVLQNWLNCRAQKERFKNVEVLTAVSRREAIALAQELRPLALVVDIDLGPKDRRGGIEAVHEIRRLYRPGIVYLTSHSVEGYPDLLLETNQFRWVRKDGTYRNLQDNLLVALMSAQQSAPSVFVSYSHKQKAEKDQLVAQFKVLQGASDAVVTWVDDRIAPGADWVREIRENIERAKVAILMISEDYLRSDSYALMSELPIILKQKAERKLEVVPIIARDCAWETHIFMKTLNVLPKGGAPIWEDGMTWVPSQKLAAIVRQVIPLF